MNVHRTGAGLLVAALLLAAAGCADRPDPRRPGRAVDVRIAPEAARALREPPGLEAPVGTFRLVVEGVAGLTPGARSGQVILERRGSVGASEARLVRKFSLFPEGAEPATMTFDVTSWVRGLGRESPSGLPDLRVRVTAAAPSTGESPSPDAFRAASARLEYVPPHR